MLSLLSRSGSPSGSGGMYQQHLSPPLMERKFPSEGNLPSSLQQQQQQQQQINQQFQTVHQNFSRQPGVLRHPIQQAHQQPQQVSQQPVFGGEHEAGPNRLILATCYNLATNIFGFFPIIYTTVELHSAMVESTIVENS